jgi:hypothetical protein
MRAELTRSKRAGPCPDRWPIVYRTFHCYDPDCPEGRWPDGVLLRRGQPTEQLTFLLRLLALGALLAYA